MNLTSVNSLRLRSGRDHRNEWPFWPEYARRQAAAYLGIAEQTLAVWKCTGRYHLPWIKIGRLVRYRKQDLDAFIARHAEGTEHPAFMFRDIANGRAIGGQ